MSVAAIQSAKSALAGLLARGEREQAEACLQPGLQYAVNIQALAEIGSQPAAELLHRQLQRRVSDDPVEQSCYWIDVAHHLRRVRARESLPHLLYCPASSGSVPLSPIFAAETVCCPGFSDSLRHPESPLGRAAARLLHQALCGIRSGLSQAVIARGRLGEAIALLWQQRPPTTCPTIAGVFVEALRLLRRAEHYRLALGDGAANMRRFDEQIAEVRQCHAAICDYLAEARAELVDQLKVSDDSERGQLLTALTELRADAADVVLSQLPGWPEEQRDAGVRLLEWSPDRRAAEFLMDWADGAIQPHRRARRAPRARAIAASIPEAFPYAAILSALRGRLSVEVEVFLLIGARDYDPAFRAAAIRSLGWSEPMCAADVIRTLQSARADSNFGVRRAAEASLARLGERRALQSVRGWLAGDSETAVGDIIPWIAEEGLTWLWPELDALADSDDRAIALTAREALEQLRELIVGGVLGA